MEKVTIKVKVIFVIFAIVIIAGIATIVMKGFEKEISMQDNNSVELNIGKDFEISDIKNITSEVFQNDKIVIQKVEVFEDTVSIKAKEISEEQKNQLVEKVNEKYSVELKADEIEIQDNTKMKIMDLIKPYIFPFGLAMALVLIYMAVRYKKLGMIKTLVKTLSIVLIIQAVLFSVIAITRIPIGRFTIPMAIVVYLITLFMITNSFETKLTKLNEENK